MNIHNLTKQVDDVFYDLNFLQLIEDNLVRLRNSNKLRTVTVTQLQNLKYISDFYGLLEDCGVEKKYHHIVMRFNGFEATTDFIKDIDYFLLPDEEDLIELKSLYMTRLA